MDNEVLRRLANVGLALIEDRQYVALSDVDYKYCVLCDGDCYPIEQHADDCPIPEALEAYEELRSEA